MSHDLRVILKPGRSKPFWVGHPWVFSGAIKRVEGSPGEMGAPCLVEDERGNVVGSGFYNPNGRIAVRLMQHRRSTDLPFEPRPFTEVVTERLALALTRRQILGLPNDQTTVYRLVNAEGDGLTGLVVDVLGDVVVAQIGSRHVYENREAIVDALSSMMAPAALVTAISDDASRMEMIPAGRELVRGELEGPLEVREHGVRFSLDPMGGQKTGFFADQRENRARFGALCAGRSVLDLYAYVGAFGLHAANAGASSVLSVETSAPALKLLDANARLNGMEGTIQSHSGDVMTFMKEARAQGRRWDRIICDPPKFARGRSHMEDALKKYARLNTLALACLEPGGLLLTCSCSQHVSERDFLRVLTDAGHRLRRGVEVHGVWGQGPDHPFAAVAPEGRYLKAALVSLD